MPVIPTVPPMPERPLLLKQRSLVSRRIVLQASHCRIESHSVRRASAHCCSRHRVGAVAALAVDFSDARGFTPSLT